MKDADWLWFRYPYLREGDTLEKRHALARFLKDQGYRVAQVTMNFDDYAYNDPYTRCLAKNDLTGIVYAIDPDQALPTGVTLLEQMLVAKGIRPKAPSDDALARLAELCR
jgi:hypothetical protein